MNLSIVIPCYNEEENLDIVYRNIMAYIPPSVSQYEIIFVNDGSTDNTSLKLEELKAKNTAVKSIDFAKNRGYGAAVRAGLLHAHFDYIIYLDGDGQYDFQDTRGILELMLKENIDIIGGMRINRQDTKGRIILALLGEIICRVVFKIRLHDIDCGFKAINKNKLQNINLKADSGLLFSLELYCKAQNIGLTIKQVTVNHSRRTIGTAKGINFKQYYLAFKDVVKNRRKLL